MTQAATRLPTKTDRLLDHQNQIKDIYGLNRTKLTSKTIQNPAFGSAGAGGDTSSAATGASLQTQGDTMIGPIAFFPVDVFIDSTTDPANPSINIGSGASNPPDFSTYVLVTGSGTDDQLNTIYGAAFAGQMLKMQAIVDIEIFDGGIAGNGNLVLNGIESTNLAAGSITEFLFDITASPNGNNGGWRLASTGNAGLEDAFLVARLSADYPNNGVIPWDLSFPLGDETRIVVTATDGVYEIVDGLFQLKSTLGVEMSESGAGSEAVALWQSASAEGGPWTDIANNSTVLSTFSTGRPTFTVQPSCSVLADARGTSLFVRVETTLVSGTFNNVMNLSSFATIEFLNGGAGGGSGGGGASSLGELSDVTLTSPATDEVLTYDGAQWVNASPAGGGMNTDLSNMASPTVPTVDLVMNGQSVTGILNADFDGFGGINGLSSLDWFQTNQNISSLAQGLVHQVAALQEHLFVAGGVSIGKFDEPSVGVYELSMENNRISNADSIAFPTGSANQIINQFSLGYNNAGSGIINWKQDDNLIFQEQGTNRAAFRKVLTVGYALEDIVGLQLEDSTTDPFTDGQIYRNSSDVLIYSGGAIRNASDIGGGGSFISAGDSNVTVTDTGVGAVTITVDGTALASFTTGVGVVFEKPLSMVANNIVGTGDVTPNGNMIRNLGGSTTFWASTFANRYYVNNTGNFLSGDSFGIDYHVDGSRAHTFDIGGTQKMSINASEIDFLDDLNTNGNDLRMNNGDITGVDVMSMNGSGSTIASIDFITFFDSGGFLNMTGSDILNGGDANFSGSVECTECEINGALNHDGSTLGFFGQSPTSRKNYNFLVGTESLLQVIGKLNELAAIFGDTGSNYGLINTN